LNHFDKAIARLKMLDSKIKDPYKKAIKTGTLKPWHAWQLKEYSIDLKGKQYNDE